MKKLSILVILLLLNGVLMSNENKNNEYIPNDYLVDFILQSILESVPHPWITAKMIVTIGKNEKNRNVIDTKYTFKRLENSDFIPFQVKNKFGPMNAANKLKQQMSEEGKNWSTAIIIIHSTGNYKVDYK
ncbi:hypothetical protein [Sulfurospirillum arcachonense]|uniref:hypothetical protein n=1 Tax=Sulfurospirillum arcachonense TaxID=57666 RepID=UPI000468ACB0|nr:hypothetical protein [Sulfurospirillum arcachonense]